MDVDEHGIIALAGAFSDTADFDPSPSSFPLTSAGDLDAFVARLDENGAFIFARSWGGSGVDEARDLAIDAQAGITTVGRFAHLDGDAADFDPGPGTYLLEESGATGSGDWFLSHLDFRTLRVTTTSDSGVGSLREAIQIANAMPGPDHIEFSIPTSDPNFVDVDAALPGGDADSDAFVIALLSALPALNDAGGGTTIDGASAGALYCRHQPVRPGDCARRQRDYGVCQRVASFLQQQPSPRAEHPAVQPERRVD